MVIPKSGVEFENELLKYLLPFLGGTPGAVLMAAESSPSPLSA
jgi:hypothetical protein